MTIQALVTLVFESAIGAQLALFSLFLLSNHRRGPALFLLAGLSAALSAMVSANLLISAAGWDRLGDAVLFLDLAAPPLFYLYVRQMHWPAPSMRPRDLAHLVPALAGLALWKSGAVQSVDAYVIACWAFYLVATVWLVARDLEAYAPQTLRRFIAELTAVLGVIVLLRIVMAVQASRGMPFQAGLPYSIVLGTLLLVTGRLLFAALRYPNLLSTPGSYVKYASAAAETGGGLEQRFADLMREQRPFLNPDLTLAEVAVMLGAPARQVSQFVNTRFKTNVPALLNQLRVQEAARLLSGEPDKAIKIVMFEAGFKSKSIFNREFQRCMGTSPSVYRRDAARDTH